MQGWRCRRSRGAAPSAHSRPRLRGNDRGWDLAGRRSIAPGVGHLVEHPGAEAFRGAGDRLAAERAVELERRGVVGQGPHYHALQAALAEVAAHRGEQLVAEAQALEFGAQIELVDLAVVIEAAGAVAAVIGIARDGLAE